MELSFAYRFHGKLIISHKLLLDFYRLCHIICEIMMSFVFFSNLFSDLFFSVFECKINKMNRRVCTVLRLWFHYPLPSWSPLQFGTIWWLVIHSSLHIDGSDSGSVVNWPWGKHQWCQETGYLALACQVFFLAHFGNIELGNCWANTTQILPPLWVLCYLSAQLPTQPALMPFSNLRR